MRVRPRTHLGQPRAQRRGPGGSNAAQLLVFPEFRFERLALRAAGGARSHVGQDFEIAHARAQFAVPPRPPDLRLEFRDAPLELGNQVVDANRVGFGLVQPAQRLVLARQEPVDAGRLLEERSPVRGLAREHRIDLTLRDDRVAPRPESRSHQEVLDIAQPALIAVNIVFDLARSVSPARDLDFAEIDWEAAIGVVEGDRDFRQSQRFTFLVAGEDHVLHLARAQTLAALLAQRPAKRVDQVGFAGTVGADDSGDPARKFERGRFREGLEAKSLDALEFHHRFRARRASSA